MRPYLKTYSVFFLGLALILASFYSGFLFGKQTALVPVVETLPPATTSGAVLNGDTRPGFLAKDVDFQLFWNVWKLIKDRSVKEDVFDTELFYGAISGLVDALDDPYSIFFNPEDAQKFTRELGGSFEGVGMEIGIKKGQLVVVAPLPGTPADRAGLRPKDAILSIDGESTAGVTTDYAVSKIRGQGGTTVALSVFREGWKEPRDVPIVRERIIIPSARFEMKGDLAYIRLTHFNSDTTGKFRQKVTEALLQNPKGLIVDVRNNAGGFLDTSVDIASEWLENGTVIVTEKFRNGSNAQEHTARGRARLKDIPTVVLVNEGSASASEILAGALQDYTKATVIGEKTFGKGSVQELESLPDGSAVKITVAKWYTPNGRSIDDEGVEPNILITLTNEDYDSDRDPQLEAAIKVLHGEEVEEQKTTDSAP